MKRRLTAYLLAAVIGTGFIWLWNDGRQHPSSPFAGLPDRIEELKSRVPLREKQLEGLVDAYQPTVKGRLDDFRLAAAEILRGLPGVESVTSNGVKNPTGRIVHFVDFHTISYKDAIANEKKVRPNISAESIALIYQNRLLEVQLVRLDEYAALRCLVQHHGLEELWGELAPNDVVRFHAWVDQLKKAKTSASDANVNTEADATPEQQRKKVDDTNPLLRLVLNGLIKDILPADDVKLVAKSGTMPDSQLTPMRDKAIAQRMTGHGKFGVIILGGAHNLGPYLPAGVEYLRVSVKALAEILRTL